MTKKGFTLVELMVVMAIMAMLGAISVGGYRAMQRGMEDRGTLQNANEFIRSAYQRAQIDRQPVNVYFWNELLREETDDDPPIVVGKAVAVRRAGRLSAVSNDYLYDEFGDIGSSGVSYSSEEDDGNASGSGHAKKGDDMFLYRIKGSESKMERSVVSQSARYYTASNERLLESGTSERIATYAFIVIDDNGVSWKRGDAYGFEFAEIQLPHNYIFGSDSDRPRSTSNPVKEIGTIMRFRAGSNSGNGSSSGISGTSSIEISNVRPAKDGTLQAQKVGTTRSPDSRR